MYKLVFQGCRNPILVPIGDFENSGLSVTMTLAFMVESTPPIRIAYTSLTTNINA